MKIFSFIIYNQKKKELETEEEGDKELSDNDLETLLPLLTSALQRFCWHPFDLDKVFKEEKYE